MKTAIIIGATSGIGRAMAMILVNKGFRVAVTGRRKELLEGMEAEFPGKIICRQMDVRDTSTIPAICNELLSELGSLDLLVISAGVGEANRHLDFHIEHDVIRTNVEGFTCVADWTMNVFRQQGRGHLVNISSIAGIRGNRVAPSYNASKAYQINYLEGLRMWADKRRMPIHVTDVRPGFVDTAMAKGEGMFWVAPVDKAARQIVSAIERKKKVVHITRRWSLISLLLKVLPYGLLKRV